MNKILKTINSVMKSYMSPMPENISYWWNFGSLLGFTLIIQILSGLFLSMYFENSFLEAFNSISQMERNINMGWLIRSIHANGASLFFIFIYLHIGRGLFFKSFNLKNVWLSGVTMLLFLFMIAFIGYVLPWGQMSFWGATVITNLLSSLPYIGKSLTIWLWGDFSISKMTLLRFFSFHFLFPFILLFLVMIHILLLHEKSSNNPLGSSQLEKIPFHPFFSWKDLLGVMVCLNGYLLCSVLFPYILMDPDNFIPANPMSTPPHIQPEWYFLFAYAILRTIPNKLGGVIALVSSILILCLLPFFVNKKLIMNNFNSKIFYKLMFFLWVNNFIFLTKMGAMPIEEPFTELSKISSLIYFMFFAIYI